MVVYDMRFVSCSFYGSRETDTVLFCDTFVRDRACVSRRVLRSMTKLRLLSVENKAPKKLVERFMFCHITPSDNGVLEYSSPLIALAFH